MTAPLFYADSLPEHGIVVLSGDEARHGAGSLRLQPDEPVLVGDGRGRLATGRVRMATRTQVEIILEEVTVEPQPADLRVVQAIPKGERGDLAVELLTETGASAIVPWASTRTVVDWRGKEQAKRQRWERVAKAAAMQARRAFVPPIESLVRGIPDVQGLTLVLHEQADETLYDLDLPAGPVMVVIGPEGGLTDQEVTGLRAHGARIVGLGPRILRTSTAGAAACVWIRGIEMRRGA